MGIRIISAGLAGGIIIFICGAAAHMATPLGHMGFKNLASDDAALVGAMTQSMPESGMYFVPGIDMTGKATEQETKAWEAKLAAGPRALVIYHSGGTKPMSAGQLLTELLACIAAALLAGFIAIRVVGGYVARLLVVALLGPITWLSVSASYWNWYGFPSAFSAAEFIMEAASWLIAAFFIAAIARPGAASATDSPPSYDLAA